MSLIQEALKRKTEEKNDPQSPPRPPALPAKKKARKFKPAVTMIIFLATMTALALFGYDLITKSVQSQKDTPTSKNILHAQNIPIPASPHERQKRLHSETETPRKDSTEGAQKESTDLPEQDPPRLFKRPAITKKSASWPVINLTGFGTAPDGRLAIINGKIMREGQTIEGATITHILAHKIIMEYQGETRSLTPNSK